MTFLSRPLSLAVGVAAYVGGTALAGLAAVLAVQSFGAVVLEQVAPSGNLLHRKVATDAPPHVAVATPIERREAAMTPLNDKRPVDIRLAAGPEFGSSSRSYSRWSRPYWDRPRRSDDDNGYDDDRPHSSGTFRTVCVRLCDGYYFPVSFAVPADGLQHDSNICQSRCGAQGRLFVYRNPGGGVEDMEDLNGRPYRQLPTAFRYRTEYVSACKCQADPWERASLDRHRSYALADEARKGNKDAAKELQALRSKMSQLVEAPAQPSSVAREGDAARRIDEERMGLGGRSERAPSRGGGSLPDWFKRAFGG